MAITIFFSFLALMERENWRAVVLNIVAAVMWFGAAPLHLSLSPVDTAIQVAPVPIYLGLGMVWMALTVKSSFDAWKDALLNRGSVDQV
jgi:hypothetical protein